MKCCNLVGILLKLMCRFFTDETSVINTGHSYNSVTCSFFCSFSNTSFQSYFIHKDLQTSLQKISTTVNDKIAFILAVDRARIDGLEVAAGRAKLYIRKKTKIFLTRHP